MAEPQTLLGVQTFCAHTTATTKDTHLPYPEKVWTCDGCGLRFRHYHGCILEVAEGG